MKKVLRGIGIVLICIVIVALIGGWAMFGAQIKAANTVERLAERLYCLEYRGDYGFAAFLRQGGAADSDALADYIISFLSHGFWQEAVRAAPPQPGCSTLTAASPTGGVLFGRNYDWEDCGAMLVHTAPEDGYASVSTVCLDFLGFGSGWQPDADMFSRMMALAAVYVPLDGMNEKGLCVADLMAGDDVETHQDTAKPDLTGTTAVRLLLDYAATVDEALALLARYDINSDIGTAHHFAIADAGGNSVVVEYIDGVMQVSETAVVTNHYLAEAKAGVGSAQSHARFATLSALLAESGAVMTAEQMRDSLAGVAQSNYSGVERTQWSLVFDTQALRAQFYHLEQFDAPYTLSLSGEEDWLQKR